MRRAIRSNVHVARRGDEVALTLNLGDGRLGIDDHVELARRCDEIDLDDGIRVVVVRSRGPDFCVGDDESVTPDGLDGIAALGRLRVPTVALISGRAWEAGLELALACDLRLAATGASFVLGGEGARLPFHGGTQRLPRAIGSSRAARMLLVGEKLGARQARDAGLVQHVARAGELESDAKRWIAAIRARAPLAQRLAKEAMRAAADLPLAEGLRLEGDLYVLLHTTRDRDEGIASFREKRRPRFRGN